MAADIAAQKAAAVAELVRATRAAFGVEPLTDAGGLTEAETLKVLTGFLAYLIELADAAGPFATSRPRDSPLPAGLDHATLCGLWFDRRMIAAAWEGRVAAAVSKALVGTGGVDGR